MLKKIGLAYFENDLEYARNGYDNDIGKYQEYILKLLDTHTHQRVKNRSSHKKVFLGKGVLRISTFS